MSANIPDLVEGQYLSLLKQAFFPQKPLWSQLRGNCKLCWTSREESWSSKWLIQTAKSTWSPLTLAAISSHELLVTAGVYWDEQGGIYCLWIHSFIFLKRESVTLLSEVTYRDKNTHFLTSSPAIQVILFVHVSRCLSLIADGSVDWFRYLFRINLCCLLDWKWHFSSSRVSYPLFIYF